MYKIVINKIKNFNLKRINIFIYIISFIIYLMSIYLVKNIYLLIIIYFFLFILYSKINHKVIEFFVYILGILLIGYIFINLLNLNIFILDYKKIFIIIIKLFYLFSYFSIFLLNIKNKRKEYLKIKKGKKYTFKELRGKKIEQFRNDELAKINYFIDKQGINNSEYEKIIRDNLSNLTDESLDKYIWVNYLRFYKNQKKQKNNNITKSDLVFLTIHVIILLLSLLVR
ncbi:MAG: hypothetical protein MR266_03630 [Erysipelotrichaceae bacterium]|nr:hypothetical protein [Erysipelotrichaceae bacterium]